MFTQGKLALRLGEEELAARWESVVRYNPMSYHNGSILLT
jgi:hypothetical protein